MNTDQYQYHPVAEQLVNVLSKKTQSKNKHFFRILTAYYFAKVASMMRTNIKTHDRGVIPINMYVLNLMPSGSGKGFSTNIMEEHVLHKFKAHFLENTFPALAESQIAKLALERAAAEDMEQEDAEEKVKREFESLGHMVFSFDSGTSAAIKQMRQKLLMAGCGSMAFEMDEVGSNILGNMEVLNTFLELYDVGKIKQKLLKNTKENTRIRELDGKTPTNMMLFGTPSKLLDGDKTESEFITMLETGYARRLFFGFTKEANHIQIDDPNILYDLLTKDELNDTLESLANKLLSLAQLSNFNKILTMDKAVSLRVLEYKIYCDNKALDLKEHQEVQKAEIAHRYYKALKLSGAYAFVDGSDEITMEHLEAAIKLAEDSGNAFELLNTRPRNYVRLAEYIANVDKEVTQVDLVEELGFYRGSEGHKRELMQLAIAWGYKNNIIIKRNIVDNIEFLKGESLKKTDLDKLRLSYSQDLVKGYLPQEVPFDQLHTLTTQKGYHWCTHHFIDQYRTSQNAIAGFNLLVLDVDGDVSISTAQLLLKDYMYLISTTKSHTDSNNRFRVVIPLTHHVKLSSSEYSKYMENVFEWIPFPVDKSTKDIARKWETYPGKHWYNDGELLDGTLFIPQTKKSEDNKALLQNYGSLTAMEKWFLRETSEGNRSNMLLKYGFVLIDSGYPLEAVRSMIDSFNEKLDIPLTDKEISETIMITLAKKIATKG